MPFISKTPRPPSYAVVFTSINADADHTEHVEAYGRLVARARTYEGYLGIKGRAQRRARLRSARRLVKRRD